MARLQKYMHSLFRDMYPLPTAVRCSIDDSVVVIIKVVDSGKATWMF